MLQLYRLRPALLAAPARAPARSRAAGLSPTSVLTDLAMTPLSGSTPAWHPYGGGGSHGVTPFHQQHHARGHAGGAERSHTNSGGGGPPARGSGWQRGAAHHAHHAHALYGGSGTSSTSGGGFTPAAGRAYLDESSLYDGSSLGGGGDSSRTSLDGGPTGRLSRLTGGSAATGGLPVCGSCCCSEAATPHSMAGGARGGGGGGSGALMSEHCRSSLAASAASSAGRVLH